MFGLHTPFLSFECYIFRVIMDVKTTFLNGELIEDVYMIQPEGFLEAGKRS